MFNRIKVVEMDPLLSIVLVMTFAVALASFFQKLKLSRVVGYVIGGLLLFAIAQDAGINLDLQYSEAIKSVGLILFFFEIGTLLDISEMRKNLSRVLSSELVAITIYWISASFLSFLFFSSELEKLVLFLLLTNCSSASMLAILSLKSDMKYDTLKLVILQASIEDLIQFMLFSILVVTGESRLSPYGGLIASLKLSGSAILIYAFINYILGKIKTNIFFQSPTNKFLFALLLAMSVSLAAGWFGMPEYFGAFIAGLAFKSSIGTAEISEMLSSFWELGILFYFSSIGADLVRFFSVGGWLPILIGGVAFGIVSIAIRSFALSVGGILSGVPLETAVENSLFISTMSEDGIIFIGILGSKGIIPPFITGLSVIAVITSLLFQQPVVQRSYILSMKATRVIPESIRKKLSHLSMFYYMSVDLALKAFSISSYFFASLLAITYSMDVARFVFRSMNLSAEVFNVAIAIARMIGLLSITVLYFLAIRSIYKIEANKESPEAKGDEVFNKVRKFMGILISAIAALVQLNILKDAVADLGVNLLKPLESIIFIISVIGILATLIFGFKYKAPGKDEEKLK